MYVYIYIYIYAHAFIHLYTQKRQWCRVFHSEITLTLIDTETHRYAETHTHIQTSREIQ